MNLILIIHKQKAWKNKTIQSCTYSFVRYLWATNFFFFKKKDPNIYLLKETLHEYSWIMIHIANPNLFPSNPYASENDKGFKRKNNNNFLQIHGHGTQWPTRICQIWTPFRVFLDCFFGLQLSGVIMGHSRTLLASCSCNPDVIYCIIRIFNYLIFVVGNGCYNLLIIKHVI